MDTSKQFIKEYVSVRGGVSSLEENEKIALASLSEGIIEDKYAIHKALADLFESRPKQQLQAIAKMTKKLSSKDLGKMLHLVLVELTT